MGISTKHHTGKDSIVMPDPFERPKLPPKFAPSSTVKLLWFGSQSSFKFFPFVEILATIRTRNRQLQIHYDQC